MKLIRPRTQPSAKGPAASFTGTVRVDMLNDPPPPARTSWASMWLRRRIPCGADVKRRLHQIGVCMAVMQAFAASAQPATAPAGVQITRAGAQPSAAGPEAFFTGRARVDPIWPANADIPAAGANVTFEAGARSAWHTHPAGQYLVIVSGVGRTQEWGKPLQEIRPGDIVWCPPGVKHWHGASPTTAMTHLSVAGTVDGKYVNWMEKVSDEQYNAR